MIQGRIEDGTVVLLHWFHLDFREVLVPGRAGRTACAVEVPAGDFGLQVLAGAFPVNGRYAHLGEHLLTLGGGELQQHLAARLRVTLLVGQRVAQERIRERFRELGIEAQLLGGGPVEGPLVALYLRVAYHLHLHVEVHLVLH